MGNRKDRNEARPSARGRAGARLEAGGGGRRPAAGRGVSRETTVPPEALVSPRHEQHTRKGQAQSPRELTHNEPPRRKRRGGPRES